MSDYMRVFEDFWRPLISTDGMVDMDKVARELADWHCAMGEVSKVYDHVTGGLISKPNTLARHVIAAADDRCTEDVNEAVKEAREEWEDEQAALPPPPGSEPIHSGAAQPRMPTPGVLERCCSHLLGDCELHPDGFHNSQRWHCRCCGASWHWTETAPGSRVIPTQGP